MMIIRYWIPEYFKLKAHVYGVKLHEINLPCMQAMSEYNFTALPYYC